MKELRERLHPHLQLVPQSLLRNSPRLHQPLDQTPHHSRPLLDPRRERSQHVARPLLSERPCPRNAGPEFHPVPGNRLSSIAKARDTAPTWVAEAKQNRIKRAGRIGTRFLCSLNPSLPLPPGVSRLVQAMSAWSVKTRRAPSRHCRGARVHGHMTAAMHDSGYTHTHPEGPLVHQSVRRPLLAPHYYHLPCYHPP